MPAPSQSLPSFFVVTLRLGAVAFGGLGTMLVLVLGGGVPLIG